MLPCCEAGCRLAAFGIRFCCLCLLFACSTRSITPVSGAVETLHDQLRDCVDLMGIGLGGQRSDTIAEEGTAITKDQPKDIGDVRSAPLSHASKGWAG